MSIEKLTVTKITDGEINGNKILKLRSDEAEVEIQTPLGTEVRRRTYYKSVKNTELKEGETVELEMNNYNITERPFDHPESGEIMLKWLHLK